MFMHPEGGGCLFSGKEGGGGTVGLFLDRGYDTASLFLRWGRGYPPLELMVGGLAVLDHIPASQVFRNRT